MFSFKPEYALLLLNCRCHFLGPVLSQLKCKKFKINFSIVKPPMKNQKPPQTHTGVKHHKPNRRWRAGTLEGRPAKTSSHNYHSSTPLRLTRVNLCQGFSFPFFFPFHPPGAAAWGNRTFTPTGSWKHRAQSGKWQNPWVLCAQRTTKERREPWILVWCVNESPNNLAGIQGKSTMTTFSS